MRKNSRPIRIPYDAWENFNRKLEGMQSMLREDLNIKNRKLHMTDALRFFSQKKTIVYPDELNWYLNNKRRKRKSIPVSI